MKRRDFLGGSVAAALLAAIRPAFAQGDFASTVLAVETQLTARRSAGQAITVDWLIASLGSMDDRLLRIAAFELVRRVPYKLSSWTGDPESLFNAGRGDCRHKEAAARRFLSRLGYRAVHIQVLFDWADLPIPGDILGNLNDTRGFHDTVEWVDSDGRRVLVDPTWDPALAAAGFPVLPAWDGVSSTMPVTNGTLTAILPGDIPEGVSLYDHFGLRWPVRERTLAFNRAFNAWSDTFRSVAG